MEEEHTHDYTLTFKTPRAAMCSAIAWWLNRTNADEQNETEYDKKTVAGSFLKANLSVRDLELYPALKCMWKLVNAEDGTYSPAKAAAVNLKKVMAIMSEVSDLDLGCFVAHGLFGPRTSSWVVRVDGAIASDL
jgi:hypothetical protein